MQELRSIQKRLAMPGRNSEPTFEAVSRVASTAAFFRMSVKILCLTQDQLIRWRSCADRLQADGLELQVHDLNRATLTEWKRMVGQEQSDLTVLAGFHAAKRRREISTEYATSLIDAVSDGLVVMA